MPFDQTYCINTTSTASYYPKVMKRTNYRKLRSQSASKARTTAQKESSPFDNISERSKSNNRYQLRHSSISPPSSQPTDANASFISVSSVTNEDFNTVPTENSNFTSQQSLDNNLEDIRSNLIINLSESSLSRSSSVSLSRGDSFIGTESVISTNSRSRASSPFVNSEISSDRNSETASTNHSRRSSILFQPFNYEENSDDDNSSVVRPLNNSILGEELETFPTNIDDDGTQEVRMDEEEEQQQQNFSINRALNSIGLVFWNKLIGTIILAKEWIKRSIRSVPSRIYSFVYDNWLIIFTVIFCFLLYNYFPCNVTDLKSLEFAECITKINNVIRQINVADLADSSISHTINNKDNIETSSFEGDNDALIRDVVADQVKTVCAAEVQKRIPTQNYDLTTREDIVVDMVRQEIRKAVEEMLYTYSQDKLNKADFALSSGGAKIIVPLTSPTYEQWPTSWFKLAIAKLTGSGITRGKPPITALQPETHVGQCWPFAGQQGQLAVLLSRRIYVTAITYDHVSKTVAMGTTSAPKEFEVWAFIDDDNDSNEKTDQKMEQKSDENIDYVTSTLKNIPSNQPGSNILDSSSSSSSSSSSLLHSSGKDLKLGSSPNHLFLGRFIYDINGLPIQTFEVDKWNKPVRAIIMKINSNWDNPSYTCLYRFRVHGRRADANQNFSTG
ncbi:hypothetical protein RhiirA1_420146 [Rhizophagus irregularis]|uniref:SUN domain-containing protein n=2 Tax=Rhizophagus irregularis TaxID=588596 RepID=A0A2I1EWR8_9GLOM|nr:hypothetical protein GLOIN_2v1714912 [Rhizophagus irregularis DAOM 181602=DAOM 197198]PKC65694.1 hypothetical protein RhiirA1_420146 [Rhizophagus irregularis]PKY26570.1 hypothetical protein RhiirB3_415304 [Rhizophagus irregularis]POG60281.1 hypothetical protein GLOIN_2v1714912 [Rhizophagus irregularis DAOM 181602=DAOM 197198]UZO29371.1 hypothetical protein OCT59_022850 [Rhizophagus irregularis]CAB4495146.1 unnamed protein product [Rhizophagus irregularis]|eukprot:XP_025167147.1 hypothetical protein GLOIN_2v1714912 [Rhizophagus irregularis DAOM 181602=DAOM 197198]